MRQPDITTDGRVMTNGNTSKDRGVRIDRHIVLYDGVTRNVQHISLLVVLKALGTERHTLIERHMTADDGGLANHDTRTVVDGEILTNLGSWMDINTRLRVSLFRNDTRDDRHFQFVQPMSDTIVSHRVHAGIAEDDLTVVRCSRVVVKQCLHIGIEQSFDFWQRLDEE